MGGQVRAGSELPPILPGNAHCPPGHTHATGHLQHHVWPTFRGDEHVSSLGLRVKLVAEDPAVGGHLETEHRDPARP